MKEVAKKYEISKELYKKLLHYHHTYYHKFFDKTVIIENTRKILEGEKKYRISISHVSQAINAYRLGVIQKNRYETFFKKHNETISNKEDLERQLREYLKINTFIKLPFDINLKEGQINTYVDEVSYFDNKSIYTLTVEQQSEYYSTFYLNPTIKLIKKYLYVRFASYILSIDTYKNNDKYLTSIIHENIFIFSIFSSKIRAESKTKKFLENFISNLRSLENLSEIQYKLKYEIIQNKYFNLLPLDKI